MHFWKVLPEKIDLEAGTLKSKILAHLYLLPFESYRRAIEELSSLDKQKISVSRNATTHILIDGLEYLPS